MPCPPRLRGKKYFVEQCIDEKQPSENLRKMRNLRHSSTKSQQLNFA